MARKIESRVEDTSLTSDFGELPGYFPDDYRDRVVAARRKFDVLDRLSSAELEASFDERAVQDWDAERAKQIKILNRWLRETKAVITELMKLFHDLRDSQSVLEEVLLEQSGKRPKEKPTARR
ncbi:hypothetical protein AAFG13_18215 [Bradyrhizobium sp. B124]|uniref:hypothetical protein n=1 Tax=Bradyrhizobium sp. B124 TaxID=3140245 RepID=UPI0031832FA3